MDTKKDKDDRTPQKKPKIIETNTYNPLTILLGTAKHIGLPSHIIENALKDQKS